MNTDPSMSVASRAMFTKDGIEGSDLQMSPRPRRRVANRCPRELGAQRLSHSRIFRDVHP